MESLRQIMKQVDDKMVASFQDHITVFNGKITREQFIKVYCITLCVSCNLSASMTELKRAINDTSLIDTEADFMIACIDSEAKSVKDLLVIYEKYPNLPRCQLGGVLRRCLDSSVDLVFHTA